VAAIGALTTMGNTLQTMFGTISNAMSTAVNGG
jgi:Flp pilus assembly pilin Flp